MPQLNLTEQEKQVLIEALESYISDLRMEIADTDRQDFRNALKSRKEVLKKVLETLQASVG